MNRNQYITDKRKLREELDRKLNSRNEVKIHRFTTRERLLVYLKDKHTPRTAIELAYGLDVRLDSLSSLLKKMIDKRELDRFIGVGPRGGCGYLRRR